MSKKMKNNKLILFVPITIIMLVIFFLLLGNHSTAEAGDLNDMRVYESVLIKEGDTLTDIASRYAKEYSHFSSNEYMNAIVSLNSLSSEYIRAGEYILLPKYR